MGADDILRFKGRVCGLGGPLFRRQILKESHQSRLSIHPGMTKMYKDLKESFWWNEMKLDVANFVAQCLVCQKAKLNIKGREVPCNHWKCLSGSGTISLWIL